MSSEIHSSVTLSPAEQKRQEEERQRVLEEARRIELQRIEEERLAEQKRQVEDTHARLAVTIDQFDEQVKRIQAKLTAPANQRSVAFDFRDVCDRCDKALDQLPRGVSSELDLAVEKHRKGIAIVRESSHPDMAAKGLEAIRDQIEYFSDRYRNILKRHANQVQSLFVELRLIRSQTIRTTDAAQAEAFEKDLNGLVTNGVSQQTLQKMTELTAQVVDLKQSVEDLARNVAERERVISIVESALTEMGYEVVRFPSEEHSTEFRSVELGGGDRVDFEFDLDQNLHFAFEPAGGRNSSDAVDACHQWCIQHERLVRHIRERGVEVGELQLVPAEHLAVQERQRQERKRPGRKTNSMRSNL